VPAPEYEGRHLRIVLIGRRSANHVRALSPGMTGCSNGRGEGATVSFEYPLVAAASTNIVP